MAARSTVALVALLISAASAQAQLFRTYLSISGSDSNPCTLQQPCRLLPAALAAVQDGGEIWMLDSANYNSGPVTISKGVTILAIPGVLGSVVALGGNAIDVTTSATVTLRNLNVAPFPGNAGRKGVNKVGAGAVLIQGSNLSGFSGGTAVRAEDGGDVTVAQSVITGNHLGIDLFEASAAVSDTLIAGHGHAGLQLHASSAGAEATVVRSLFRNNLISFRAEGLSPGSSLRLVVDASVVDCTPQASQTGAFVATWTTEATITDTTVSGCQYAVHTGGNEGVKVFLARNLFSGNGVGVLQEGSAIAESAGDNVIRNNTANVVGAMTNVGSM